MPWDWPVETNYLEAKAFCNWKARKTGRKIRLPMEDEVPHLPLCTPRACARAPRLVCSRPLCLCRVGPRVCPITRCLQLSWAIVSDACHVAHTCRVCVRVRGAFERYVWLYAHPIACLKMRTYTHVWLCGHPIA